MPRKKPKPSPDTRKPALQLTKSQLIKTVSASVVFGALLLALGILLGRFEAGRYESTDNTDNTAPGRTSQSRPRETDPSAGEGTQTSPRVDMLAHEGSETPRPYVDDRDREPRFVPFPAPPPGRRQMTQATDSGPGPDDHEPQGEDEEPADSENGDDSPETSLPAIAAQPLEPEEDDSEGEGEEETTARAEDDDTQDAAPEGESDASPQPPAPGTHAVQVAAYTAPDRRERAEKFLQDHPALGADLISSEDGAVVRVMVGAFEDKQAAKKKCSELKSEFGDCFVTTRK